MKKIILTLGAIGLTVAVMPLFAAFEAHVVNVTATIENALSVPLEREGLSFGTVFPEEELDKFFDINLSQSFLTEDRVDDVEYVIRQKPKCVDAAGNHPQVTEVKDETGQLVFECPQGSHMMDLLCPYLSKHEVEGNWENTPGIGAFHGLPGPWTPQTTIATQVTGKLAKSHHNISDTWDIDLHVPCFKGSCAQDNVIPPLYQLDPELEHHVFGCDLWVETTGISPAIE